MEMTKKEMAAKLAELEQKNSELVAALIALANQKNLQYVFIPAPQPQPVTIPYTPPLQPYPLPYIGDPPYSPLYPTITCGTNVCKQQHQNTQIWN